MTATIETNRKRTGLKNFHAWAVMVEGFLLSTAALDAYVFEHEPVKTLKD